jgi:2-dehydro-3-deoxygalactonokinase
MIGVDWGTSSFRAVRLAVDGSVLARIEAPQGIMAVAEGGFAETLRAAIAPWLAAGERRVLLCGMVGSRQGWAEAAYLACPAGAEELAAALLPVAFGGAEVRIVPGLAATDADGVPEVMRGEETQVAGAAPLLPDARIACLPGTHSKWVRLEAGRIAGFATHLTGEAFAALRGHTILGRMMRAGDTDDAASRGAFDRGVVRSGEAGGLLHHLFGVRALALFGRLAEAEGASYLSGLLIGHEVRAALPKNAGVVPVIGEATLAALYARAIAACGGRAEWLAGEHAAAGLARIGGLASWN